jgi:hypothetical protein
VAFNHRRKWVLAAALAPQPPLPPAQVGGADTAELMISARMSHFTEFGIDIQFVGFYF